MAKYALKTSEVEAWQHKGPQSIIIKSDRKGEQQVRPGDFFVKDQAFIDKRKDEWQRKKDDFDNGVNPVDPGDFQEPQGSVYKVGKDEFFKDYELSDSEEASKEEGEDGMYGVPHFDTAEAAQQAASEYDGGVEGKIFHCTIGDSENMYAIGRDGVVTVVPVVANDPSMPLDPAVRDERQPPSLQNGDVHEVFPTSPEQTNQAHS